MRGAALYGGSARTSFANFLGWFLNCDCTGKAPGLCFYVPSNFSSAVSLSTEQPPAVFLQMAALSGRQLLGRGVAVRCCFPALLPAPHNRSLIRCKARTRGVSRPKVVSRNFVACSLCSSRNKIPAIPARGGFGHAKPVSRARAGASAAIMQPINERKTP